MDGWRKDGTPLLFSPVATPSPFQPPRGADRVESSRKVIYAPKAETSRYSRTMGVISRRSLRRIPGDVHTQRNRAQRSTANPEVVVEFPSSFRYSRTLRIAFPFFFLPRRRYIIRQTANYSLSHPRLLSRNLSLTFSPKAKKNNAAPQRGNFRFKRYHLFPRIPNQSPPPSLFLSLGQPGERPWITTPAHPRPSVRTLNPPPPAPPPPAPVLASASANPAPAPRNLTFSTGTQSTSRANGTSLKSRSTRTPARRLPHSSTSSSHSSGLRCRGLLQCIQRRHSELPAYTGHRLRRPRRTPSTAMSVCTHICGG